LDNDVKRLVMRPTTQSFSAGRTITSTAPPPPAVNSDREETGAPSALHVDAKMHRVITPTSGQRLAFQQLPERLKDWVGGVLGAPIVTATFRSAASGLTQQTAPRLRTTQVRAFQADHALHPRLAAPTHRELADQAWTEARSRVPARATLAGIDHGLLVGDAFSRR
jgi:hypothetical protein